MTKHEFMTRLTNELHKRNVADAADIAEEYEQHFAFKLADGYSEEEIAAKLGAPEELAAQFGDVPQADTGHSASCWPISSVSARGRSAGGPFSCCAQCCSAGMCCAMASCIRSCWAS